MSIEVHEYDPAWPDHARAAIAELRAAHPGVFAEIEHVGSTAVPGLPAKPVIDLMAAVPSLDAAPGEVGGGYALIETGMPERRFYRREPSASGSTPAVHLHVVTEDSWATRNERILRDHLLSHPAARDEYGLLKRELAGQDLDGPAYTRAKTELIQRLVDAARTERSLPLVSVWEE
ncbi:GrpB family protein [Dactylosporangium sp. CS-033363]|uniref:GrpB family protein n=1 Tax=Dactylosporangium sp. CS-033363 TaxID=3239935 RepID=UPI003D8ED3EB